MNRNRLPGPLSSCSSMMRMETWFSSAASRWYGDVLHAEIVLRHRIAASPAFKENALSNPWDKLGGVVGFVPGGIDHSYVLQGNSLSEPILRPAEVGSSVGYFATPTRERRCFPPEPQLRRASGRSCIVIPESPAPQRECRAPSRRAAAPFQFSKCVLMGADHTTTKLRPQPGHPKSRALSETTLIGQVRCCPHHGHGGGSERPRPACSGRVCMVIEKLKRRCRARSAPPRDEGPRDPPTE